MQIILARIDDRLIHGKITSCWCKKYETEKIIIVNDSISTDEIKKNLLKQVSPPKINTHIVSVNKAVRVYNNPKYLKTYVIMLFTNPRDVFRLVKKGVKLNKINIGGMAFFPGKKQISNSVAVNREDVVIFKKLNNLNIKLELRKLPFEKSINIMDLIINL